MESTPQRPYLVRAMYAWISDNGMTPHVLVDANYPHVHVPPGTAQDGKVVLNIAPRATQGLDIGDDVITFSARFNGVSQSVYLPMGAVIAVYSRESGAGMGMPPEAAYELQDGEMPAPAPAPAKGPVLTAVKTEDELTSASADTPDGDDTPPSNTPPKRGAHLRVVK